MSPRLFQLPSGLRVRVVEAGPADGRPIILLPGWAASAFAFRHQLPALGDAGYRAIAVDLKGHGFSDKPTEGGYTLDAMIGHVEEIIDAVARFPVTIVAQSMAGPIGIELARAGPETVSKLILVSPVGLGVVPFIGVAQRMAAPWVDSIAPWLVRRWIARVALGAVYGDAGRVTDRIVDEYWAPSQHAGFSRALRALVRDFAWSVVPDERLVDVSDRTLVLLGGRDRLVRGSVKRAERIFGSRVIFIPDAGHALQEECPDEVNRAILDFLRFGD